MVDGHVRDFVPSFSLLEVDEFQDQDIQSMVVLIPYTMEKPVFGNSLANTVRKENVFVFLLEH